MTNTTPMRAPFKIKINNREHFAQVQLALFIHGYCWVSGKTILSYLMPGYTLPEYLYVQKGRFGKAASYSIHSYDVAEVSCKMEAGRCTYAIRKAAQKKWIPFWSEELDALVAVDVQNTIVRIDWPCAKQALEEQGYDTSGYEWLPDGSFRRRR